MDESLPVAGELVDFRGERYYKISNVERMRPFFMSLVSDSNHWMFLSSNGGLTAGRKNSEYALFPYYTDDKITESVDTTGCKTLIRVGGPGGDQLWEPFSERFSGCYRISRNLYKNRFGNTILFEEENHDLGLTFSYQWQTSNRFGFVRKAFLSNTSTNTQGISLLDGFLNLMPHGVTTDLQQTRSNLVDAYKKSELVPESGLGIYALSAIIVDRAEPSEALKANVVWSQGLQAPTYLLSSQQLEAFRLGKKLHGETELKGEKGAYLVGSQFSLGSGEERAWTLVANVNQGPSAVASLEQALRTQAGLMEVVEADIRSGTDRLIGLAGAADGLQQSFDELRTMRHYANVMYNVMRGGIMDCNYQLEKVDFAPYLQRASRPVFEARQKFVSRLPETFTLFELLDWAREAGDADLQRLCHEYLPLKFSRRHGDPSRPWNKFSINTQRESDGGKILDYQGNWRDIFQNWEALAHSYPEFIAGMIHKFLNASTADGYNPYRITKFGVDWEVIEPDDPWSYIGYWGDHQVIYLLKFLEFSEDYFPGRLLEYWNSDLFVYVDVPYRIKPFEAILTNPKDTIEFDVARDKALRNRMSEIGSDGALIRDPQGKPYRVTLVEKLLAMLLAKVSNFVPEAGIWLNTQRPEWNDANNALVGNGVSMVTLYYLHRFLGFLEGLLQKYHPAEARVSEELVALLDALESALAGHESALSGAFSDVQRRTLTEALGRAGSAYREKLYREGFSGNRKTVSANRLLRVSGLLKRYTTHAIAANRRSDHLFHSYNLIELDEPETLKVSHLNVMLEGQVAVLSSGFLDADSSLQLLDALRSSALYRADQNSYILYPDKELPAFLEKNRIPSEQVRSSALLRRLADTGDTRIIEKDASGKYHFNGDFKNADYLALALDRLPADYQHVVEQERSLVLNLYEAIFEHRSFTGRSGTFFAYEGLGSIYWHMVSKLALAVMECCVKGWQTGADQRVLEALSGHYHEVNAGIGVHKSPGKYGAFPTDPYSHTPAHRGAQQPGMTGQVKEDILTRKLELGLSIQNGALVFGPYWIKGQEFGDRPQHFAYRDVDGEEQVLEIAPGSLAYTFCQVPVVYIPSKQPYIEIHFEGERAERRDGSKLDAAESREIIRRTGKVRKLQVGITT